MSSEPIASRERIERQARAAARTYDNVNDACPYPFADLEGQLFKTEFARARAELVASGYSNTTIHANNTTKTDKATTP